MREALRARAPARTSTLLWVAALFVAANTLVRIGLLAFEGDAANFMPLRLAAIMGVGLLYDLVAATYVLAPFALLALAFPNTAGGRTLHGAAAGALILAGIFAMLFTAAGEALFWNEFASRFNFIAVDYLVYTREVVGNIRESYPVGRLLAGLAAASAAIFLLLRRPIWRAATADGGTLRQRLGVAAVALALPFAAFHAIDDGPRERLPAGSSQQLAGNGYYEFARAFRANNLDYFAFYPTLGTSAAAQEMASEFEEAASTARFSHGRHPLERQVAATGAFNPLNVVLVTIESLGTDFVESFGGKPGLTPNLDRLAAEGLKFTQIYATGLRTVRGLEALALSLPPTPGHAVLMRKDNKRFQTVGSVFAGLGYEPLFVYGGYSYFDNMQDFFAGNGYTVVDRTAIARHDISHETIWGVADEDLFRLVVREMDARAAAGRRAMIHVMTTSNHRPFTYPAGRIDIRPGAGRDGAVKYTDWAIGDFMREAATRPWFKDTLFVFIADHTSRGRGRTDLPPENYHIPLIMYAPAHVAPRVVDTLASQIDVGPTILALLNASYTSRFFGQDILTEGAHHQRALMANYLTVGYMEKGLVVELAPKRRARVIDAASGLVLPADDPLAMHRIREAIAHYQVAAQVLRAAP